MSAVAETGGLDEGKLLYTAKIQSILSAVRFQVF
jgi:hypothetical protein